MKKFAIFYCCLFCLSANILAQSQATLQGKVTEAKSGDEAINAYLKLLQKGVRKTMVATDFEGNYQANMEEGTYDVEVSYVGMATQLIKGVLLKKGEIIKLDVKLEELPHHEDMIRIIHCPISIIQHDNFSSGATYTAEQIARSPR